MARIGDSRSRGQGTVLKMYSNWLVKARGPEPAHLLTAVHLLAWRPVVSSRGLRR
jgi:hypothetical protein